MAFTGTAVYDIYGNEVGESVSDYVSLIAPVETQFLDEIGDANNPATSTYHSWLEDGMLPRSYTVSSAIASSAGTSEGIEVGANAGYLRVNDILRVNWSNEMLFVSSIGASAATIYVSRIYAGTTAKSAAAGAALDFVGSAMTEGAGIRSSRRVGKVLKGNFVQNFREDINVSNQANNVTMKVPGLPKPYDEEVVKKTKELLIQLENSAIMGRTNGNTIGADDAEATMAGIYWSIATNIVSHATYTNSILNEMLAKVNVYSDIRANSSQYSLFAGDKAFRLISASRTSQVNISIDEFRAGLRPPTTVWTDYGEMTLRYVRALPTGTVLALRKDLVGVKPLAGNSFATRPYDAGAVAKTGFVAGSYTVEFQQEKAAGRLDGLA